MTRYPRGVKEALNTDVRPTSRGHGNTHTTALTLDFLFPPRRLGVRRTGLRHNAGLGLWGAAFTMETGFGSDLSVEARFLLEQISDACYALDGTGRFILVNEHAARLLGRPRSEMLGQNCWELFPEAVTAGLKEHYEQVVATGQSVTRTVNYPGHERWYTVRAHPVNDGVLVLFHDDTPTLALERRNRVLVEQALDGITVMDADFMPLYRSPANARILGHPPDQEMAPVTIHPEDTDYVKTKVAALDAQEFVTLDYRVQHADGRWILVTGTFTNRLADPAVRGIVLNFRDITDERNLQEEAQHRRSELLESNLRQEVHIARLDILHRVHLSSVADEDLATNLRAILNSAIKGQPTIAFIYLEDTGEIHGVSHTGLAVAAAAVPREAIHALAHKALKGDSVIRFTPDQLEDAGGEFMRQFGTRLREGRAVPFERRGVRGAVVLISPESMSDDADAASFLTTLAGYIASAVATSRLVEELERSAEDYRMLADFSMRIETVHDLDTLITAGLSELLTYLQLDNGGLAEVTGNHVVPRWRHGNVAEKTVDIIMKPIPLDRGAVAQAVRTGEAVLVRDYRDYPDRPEHLKPVNLVSLLAVPIDAGAAGRYVFILTSLNEQRLITDKDVVVATLFAKRIGNALERLAYIQEIKASREATFRSLGMALEYRDYETKGHTDRVTSLVTRLGMAVDLDSAGLRALQWGAYLHDLGKLSVPDAILFKAGPLTEEEFGIIKLHPSMGEEMCRDIPFLPADTLSVIRHHHERFNGTGYPDGLAGEAIPLSARLFALVDVYDALRSDRPYRKAWDEQQTVRYMREQSGKHFDPELLDIFLEVMEADS